MSSEVFSNAKSNRRVEVKDVIQVGDTVEITACVSHWYPTGNQERDSCFVERYRGLPKEYYMKGGTHWPSKTEATDGWDIHNLKVANGLVGQVVHIWYPGEGAFSVPATRILIETIHEGDCFYVPIRSEGVKILESGGMVKPAKRDS